MIRLKTSVLLACATQMGALLAGAPSSDAEVLYRFAEKVGLAFQLQDDYLDVYGDPKVFGKKIGGDIMCGKKTFLLISAYDHADDDMKAALLSLINDHELPANEKVRAVTDIYNTLNVPNITLSAIDHFYSEAYAELQKLSLPQSVWQPLWQYAESLLGRNK